MVYTIRITETLTRDITVKAESVQDAFDKVKSDYFACNIVLSADDCADMQMNIVKQ